jgi:hypothetical protein
MSFSESSKQHDWNPYSRTTPILYSISQRQLWNFIWWFIISFSRQFKYCKYTLLAKVTGSWDVVFATFQAVKVKSYGRTFYVFEVAVKLLGGPPCYPIGLLVELLIPIGQLFQLQIQFWWFRTSKHLKSFHPNVHTVGTIKVDKCILGWFKPTI